MINCDGKPVVHTLLYAFCHLTDMFLVSKRDFIKKIHLQLVVLLMVKSELIFIKLT